MPGFCLPKKVSGACWPGVLGGSSGCAPGQLQQPPVRVACSLCWSPSQCAALWWPSADRAHHALDSSSEAVSARASEWARGGGCANPLSSTCWVPCPAVRSQPLGSGSVSATLGTPWCWRQDGCWECLALGGKSVGLGCLSLDSQLWFSCQGVTSILPVLREGVLTGSPEQKEEAAKGLGLVIRLTSADALRPSVVSITGPLIRILGDRFNWTVKAALLETLSLLLGKASQLGSQDSI